MSKDEWNKSFARVLGMLLSGVSNGEINEQGRPLFDDDFLLLLNAHYDHVGFKLPGEPSTWKLLVSTASENEPVKRVTTAAPEIYPLEPRSVFVLTIRRPELEREPLHVPMSTQQRQPDASAGVAPSIKPR